MEQLSEDQKEQLARLEQSARDIERPPGPT